MFHLERYSDSLPSAPPQVLEYERDYMCTKCRHVFTVQADFDQFYTFAQLVACPNPDGCNSYKFSCLSEGSEPAACKDYQEIKIQEQVRHFLTTEPMDLSYGIVYFYIWKTEIASCLKYGFHFWYKPCRPFHRYRDFQWAVFLVLWWWFWRMTSSTVVNLVRTMGWLIW